MNEALAEHDLQPSDIQLVINTHLHFDHCGQNAVFTHAPFFVQRSELERARVESKELSNWFDFAGARFELLDGHAEIAEGVRVMPTPGHTRGHQSVLVDTDDGTDVLIGDAAYTPNIYIRPDTEELPPGQAADRDAWRESLRQVQSLAPEHVHFCHSTHALDYTHTAHQLDHR
jgi:glyoxylase-like metal-dependent hydrolase (beta-lactamase superfamily II)